MTAQPSRHRAKWSVDFSTKVRNNAADLPSPPGYSVSVANIHAESTRQTDPGLKAKRSWDMALGPIKQAPMNLFIMYMSGNTISIFPIMMVIMLLFRPVKTLFTVGSTFKALDASMGGPDGQSGSAIGQKIVFVIGNLVNLGLAMYKCQSMGLLPTHASDWLAFADPVERAEWAYV